jgi:hypothetical protein
MKKKKKKKKIMMMVFYKIILFFLTSVRRRQVFMIEECREDGSNEFLRKVCIPDKTLLREPCTSLPFFSFDRQGLLKSRGSKK